MKDDFDPLDRRIVAAIVCGIFILCAGLTHWMYVKMPHPEKLNPVLEYWMLFGWMTGLYLTASMVIIRPLLMRVVPLRTLIYIDMGHAWMIPFVIGGVGTWGVVKALGFL